MPQADIALGNTYDTITRPVVYSVTEQILKELGFDERAYIAFLGFTGSYINKANSLEPIKRNFFGTDTIAEIEITESPRQDQILPMGVHRQGELTVFRDERSNIYLRPVKQMADVNLTFKLRFSEKGEAMRWRDDIASKAALLRHQQYHRVTYSYPIPPRAMEFFYDMHGIIKEHDPDEPTDFAEWFFKYADERTTTLTNVGATEHMVVIPETQVRVLGWWDWSGVPDKPNWDNEKSVWEISWTYSFVYDKVIAVSLYYELLMRQQIIPNRWIPETPMDLYREEPLAMNDQQALADHFLPDFERWNGKYLNRVPITDTWTPAVAERLELRNYHIVFMALAGVTDEDPRSVADLNDLDGNGDLTFHPEFLEIIRNERDKVTVPHKSMLNITIFSNDDMALPEQQHIDENLVLKANFDLAKHPVYRIVVSVIKDLRSLDRDAQDNVMKDACHYKRVLELLYPHAAEMGLIPMPDEKCRWSPTQFEYIKDLFDPKQRNPWQWGWPPYIVNPDKIPPGHSSQMNLHLTRTVALYSIIGRRPSNASR